MKKSAILYLLLLLLPLLPHAQTNIPAIDKLIAEGQFRKAKQGIREQISHGGLLPAQIYALQFQSDLLDRIRLDFNRDEKYVRETLAPYFPALSDEQLTAWEQSGDLEMRLIDGEKRYFRNAVWNLFRVNAAAKEQKEAVDGPAVDELAQFLEEYLPGSVQAVQQLGRARVRPLRIRLTYTLRVKPDAVPAGETIRAWLPYPRADRERLAGVRLLNVSESDYTLAPWSSPHTSLYLEKKADKGAWTEFSYQVEYTAYDQWTDLLNTAVQPYDTSTAFYRHFTAEREPHLRFTPQLTALSRQITGTEPDPLQKAWRIHRWIGEHIPWASALEYSTMPDIPAYCMEHRRGDCGMKALLFIALCRHNGIPAKWQSGWFLYPVSKNLHDWAEVYFEGVGWVPVDPDFNQQQTGMPEADRFFFGGADRYRLIINDDFGGDFFPAKIHPRSETNDFQRGEAEWRGGNLYFDQWTYDMKVEYLD